MFSSALAWGDRAPPIDQGTRAVQRLALLLRIVKVHELVLMNHTFEPGLMNQYAFKHSGNWVRSRIKATRQFGRQGDIWLAHQSSPAAMYGRARVRTNRTPRFFQCDSRGEPCTTRRPRSTDSDPQWDRRGHSLKRRDRRYSSRSGALSPSNSASGVGSLPDTETINYPVGLNEIQRSLAYFSPQKSHCFVRRPASSDIGVSKMT
jgi:hypothetical protein